MRDPKEFLMKARSSRLRHVGGRARRRADIGERARMFSRYMSYSTSLNRSKFAMFRRVNIPSIREASKISTLSTAWLADGYFIGRIAKFTWDCAGQNTSAASSLSHFMQ